MRGIRNVLYVAGMAALLVFGFSSEGMGTPIMVEKNLFAQDRKPPSPDAAPAPQPNKSGLSAKSLQLDGVIMRGDAKKAIVRVKGSLPGMKTQSPYVTVGEGEKIGDLLVVKIDHRSISLEKDGQTDVIKLFAEGKIVVPAPPAPASAAVTPQAPPVPPPPDVSGQPGVRVAPQQTPQGATGGNMPGGAVQPPRAGGPPGSQRAGAPPAQNPPDEGISLDDEGDLGGEGEDAP
jgi:hypothetical protein